MKWVLVLGLLAVCSAHRNTNLNFGFGGKGPAACPPVPVVNCNATRPVPLLEVVRARGFLTCGIRPAAAFAQQIDGLWKGFDIDLCLALTAAIFGDPSKVRFFQVDDLTTAFTDMRLAKYDVGSFSLSRTAEREITQRLGFSHTTVHFKSIGLITSRNTPWRSSEQANGKICVERGSTSEALARSFFSTRFGVTLESYTTAAQMYSVFLADDAACAAVVDDWTAFVLQVRAAEKNIGVYQAISPPFAVEPTHFFTRVEEEDFRRLTSWVSAVLIRASEWGLTRNGAATWVPQGDEQVRFANGNVFEAGLGMAPGAPMAIIRAVGNLAEVYMRNFGSQQPPNTLIAKGGALVAPLL